MNGRSKYARALVAARESMESLRQRVQNARLAWKRAKVLMGAGDARAAHPFEDEFRNERREARTLAVELSAFALDNGSAEAAALAAQGFALLAEVRGIPDEAEEGEPRPPETRVGPGVTRRALERFLRDSGHDAELPPPDVVAPAGTLGTEPECVLDYDELTAHAEIASQGRDQ